MKRSLLFFVVFLAGTVAAMSQTKTVTNADLEKFRAERMKAEADYRANYARWGFPSPEELERQREQNVKELSERVERSRTQRIEQERIDAERERQAAQYNYLNSLNYAPARQYSTPYYFNYAPYGFYYPQTFRQRPRFPFNGRQKVRAPHSYLPPFVGIPPRH